ncbi:MAG: epimerase [Halioglobus sp.]|nr:epimerase [Halioglobus sp.]
MKRKSVLIVGCGDLGVRSGLRLLAGGWDVAGVRRDPTRLPEGFTAYAADYTVPGSLDFAAGLRPDYVLAIFKPTDRSQAGYQRGYTAAAANLLAGLGGHSPRAVVMVSSTRVFAQDSGGWVDEDSALTTSDPQAQAIIEAERVLLESAHSACVVRFAGIYGAPQGRLLSRIARGELCAPRPRRYGNRIHRDDCAGFLVHLLQLDAAGASLAPLYIGADDCPAEQFEVESWLARQLGVDARPGQQAPAPAAHRRCSNRRLRDTGYILRYPDYRSGYSAVLRERA